MKPINFSHYESLSKVGRMRWLAKQMAKLRAAEGQKNFRDDPLTLKAARIARLNTVAEDGKVAIMSSGRDCDGVQWRNQHLGLYPALYWAVSRVMDREYDNAEGPMSVWVERPSVTKKAEYSSRDLTMEAFENGHAHVLYSDDLD